MLVSLEQVQQLVKAWAVEEDPELEVQVLAPHKEPRGEELVIPIRLARRGYQLTVAFPEESLATKSLPEEISRTLGQIGRLLRYMETRSLPRARRFDAG